MVAHNMVRVPLIMKREITWVGNQYSFEKELEQLLSTCPNMTEKDDKRDICEKRKCPMFTYCISIEPSEVKPGLMWGQSYTDRVNRIYKRPRCCGTMVRRIYKQVSIPKHEWVPIGYLCEKCGAAYTGERGRINE